MKTLNVALWCALALAQRGMSQRYVSVGHPGNVAAPPGAGGAAGHGSVAARYRIGRWEVTNGEWAAFLRSVGTGRIGLADPHGLYDSRMTSDSRGGIIREVLGLSVSGYTFKTDMKDKPVNFVSYYDALRYCNWLHNGQSNDPDSTEDGAYNMGPPEREEENQAFPRRSGARYWLPTIDQWAKAAYFRPDLGVYMDYPGSNTAVPADASTTGLCTNPGNGRMNFSSGADWDGLNGHVLTAGSCNHSRYYGVYDAGGNVAELTETQAASENNVYRCGGAFNSPESALALTSLTNSSIARSSSADTVGFRVASTHPPPLWQCHLTYTPGAEKPVHLTVAAESGSSYKVEQSADGQDWAVRVSFFGGGGPRTFDLEVFGNPIPRKYFFRVVEDDIPSNTP